MKRNLYALLLAAVASVSSAGMASAAPAIPDRLYFPNDRGTGWIFIDNNNTQVPRFSKDKIGNVTSFSMHATARRPEANSFSSLPTPRKTISMGISIPATAYIRLPAMTPAAKQTRCLPQANTPPTATAR